MNIRNLCIIAHIDHGKSTLADRLLEMTGTVSQREMKTQLLDKMDLEREKGITIKLAPVTMFYKDHQLNLIDTPGHVDFGYEVSRSLQACEGAILVVDSSQGIEAQTLANVYLAWEHDLKIIPVLNKIDLPAASIEENKASLQTLLGCSSSDILLASAKTGQGVDKILETILAKIPPPIIDQDSPLSALIFDSYYDDYRGVVVYVRLKKGVLKKGQSLTMMAAGTEALALEIGWLSPEMKPQDCLTSGQIGYIVTNLKSTAQAQVGDTITLTKRPTNKRLPGYRPAKPYIFAGLFTAGADDYNKLKIALEKLALSDSTLAYEAEKSPILGHGFRTGFLGLLHLEIIVERLEREYGLEIIVSNPSTDYQVTLTNGRYLDLRSATDLPPMSEVAEIKEPWVKGEIVCPTNYVGAMIKLIVEARGRQETIDYVNQLAVVNFEAPLANLLTDFYDQLKSLTSGYGSLNYEIVDYRPDKLVRLDFYVAGEIVQALSLICHQTEAVARGNQVVAKLKEIIPRQQFKVALQAAIGGKFIARKDIPSFRKDVTAKLYGGDITRRKKLLEKQKKGKARLKMVGRVELPPQAFTVLLQRDD